MMIRNSKLHVGDTIETQCGLRCVVGAISKTGDRVLLIQAETGIPNYIGAWEMSQIGRKWCWEQGHYFGDDFATACLYVLT